jgi:DNA repair protein RecN (Recombination protein N)
MLIQLKVKNFKLIRDLDLRFAKGFNVITGETGAGKSMLLGALSLIMGERANKSLLKSEVKIVVEAIWALPTSLKYWFVDNDLDFDVSTIVRREISPSGKSRLFINDTPVLAATVKSFTDLVVDLHGQFDSSAYLNPKKQLEVIDVFAGIEDEVQAYHQKFLASKKLENQLAETEEYVRQLTLEKEFDDYVLAELLEANLSEEESLAELEQECQEAEQWGEFQNFYAELEQSLSVENGVEEQINFWQKRAEKLLSPTDELYVTILNIKEELSEVVTVANKRLNSSELDEERLFTVKARIEVLNHLLYKHKCTSTQELISKKEALQGKGHDFENSLSKIDELKLDIDLAQDELNKKAEIISSKRRIAKDLFAQEVGLLLQKLSMPHAAIDVKLESAELNETGSDSIRWLVKTVKGADFESLKKVASGGEISRLLLAIKCVLATKSSLPTLILDEADTGLSGQVALEIGNLLKAMGERLQIIGISHLPQVAAKAQHHIKVFKTEENETEVSDACILNHDDRVEELSEMLSGKNAGDDARNNARLLLS